MNRPSGHLPAAVRPTGQILAISDEQLEELPFAPGPLQEVLRAFVKAIRAHQMYLPNNPVYLKTVEAARASFVPVWEQADSVSLTFTETEVKWFGVAVMVEPTKSADSLPWTFFKDGIREISIKPGFEQEELSKMLDILQRARNAAPEQDDLLTMLWEADFTNLRYRYVDVGTEAVAPLEGEAGGGGGSEATDAPTTGQVRAVAQSPADSARPAVVNMQDFDATAYFLDERELDYLRREIEREYAGDLRRNVMSVLLDIWEAQPSSRDEVADLIESLLPLLLASGELTTVAYLLAETTVAVMRGESVSDEQRQRLSRIPEHLSAPEPLGQLLQALDETADQAPAVELAALFSELRPGALGTALEWIPKLRNPSVKAMVESAAERLAAAHSGELVKLILSNNAVVSSEAIRRSTTLKLAGAVPALSRVLGEGTPAVRLAVVNALTAIGSVSALQALERAVDDADREVRLAAVKTMLAKKHRGAFARLEHKVKDGKAARALDLTERTTVFEAYGAMCGEAGVPFLDGILNGKSLFGKREDTELRVCAALALGRVGGTKSKQSLQRSADEKDVVVRNAVFRALKGSSNT